MKENLVQKNNGTKKKIDYFALGSFFFFAVFAVWFFATDEIAVGILFTFFTIVLLWGSRSI
jgi:hypothetical protein